MGITNRILEGTTCPLIHIGHQMIAKPFFTTLYTWFINISELLLSFPAHAIGTSEIYKALLIALYKLLNTALLFIAGIDMFYNYAKAYGFFVT
jgi:hypothetical protein